MPKSRARPISPRWPIAGDCLTVLVVALLAAGGFMSVNGVDTPVVLWSLASGFTVGLIMTAWLLAGMRVGRRG